MMVRMSALPGLHDAVKLLMNSGERSGKLFVGPGEEVYG